MAVRMKMAVFWLLRLVVWYKFTDVSEVLAASIIREIAAQQPRRQPSLCKNLFCVESAVE
jgi:hypothetical protein